MLDYSQNPVDCTTANLATFKFFDRGVGSDMHYLAYALLVAFHSNRTLVLEPHTWRFADPENCPNSRGLECYFLPLSTCNWNNSAINENPMDIIEYMEPTNARIVRVVNSDLAKRLRYNVPEQFSGRRNTEWVWSVAVAYVMRLNERTRALVEQRIEEVGLDEEERRPIISMHVRRGDKVQFKEAESFDLMEYIRHADQLRAIHQAETIFLLSDDAEIIQAANNLTGLGWKVLYQETIRRTGGFQHGWMDSSDEDKSEIVMSVIYDIFLGAQGDFFVGTFSSNFGRLVWETMLVRHGGVVPGFASLDKPWLPRPP